MKNIFFNYCALFLTQLCISSYTSCYIIHLSSWAQSDKKIVLIGDLHSEREHDPAHKKILAKLLNQLTINNQPSEFILEAGPVNTIEPLDAANLDQNSLCFNDHFDTNYLILLRYIRSLCAHHIDKNRSLALNFGDVRFSSMSFFEIIESLSCISFFQFLSLGNNSGSMSEAFKKKLETSAEEISKRNINMSSKNLVEALDYCLAEINQFKNEAEKKEVKEVIEQIEQSISHYKQDITELFKKYPECSIYKAFVLEWCKHGNVKDFYDLAERYFEPFVQEVADAFFIINILKSQKKHNLTIAFTGAAHSRRMETMLEHIAYKQLDRLEGHQDTAEEMRESMKQFGKTNMLTRPIAPDEVTKFFEKHVSPKFD